MRVTCCGGAGEVGASCILLEITGKRILLDCGCRIRSGDSLPDLRSIQERGGIDAAVLSHAHLDHSGSLPVICREYPQAPIFMTPSTRDLVRVLLYDSLKIMHREMEIPVFAESHVETMLERIHCHSYQYAFDVGDIEISRNPNQIELLQDAEISTAKNPGIHTDDMSVRVKLSEDVPKELWEKLDQAYFHRTGYHLRKK